MDIEDDLKAVLGRSADGPPMRLEAADVIARGGRIRRLRKRWAVAGSSVATAIVIAVAGFAAGHRVTTPTPVEPARPELSTVVPTPTAPESSTKPPVAAEPQTPSRQMVPDPPTARPGTTRPTRLPTATRKPSPTETTSATAPTAVTTGR